MSANLPVMLVCGSVVSSPDASYLSSLHSALTNEPCLVDLRHQLLELEDVWSLLNTKSSSLKHLDIPQLLHAFTHWILTGDSSALLLDRSTSRNTRAAVLTVLIHIIEYAGYLNQVASLKEQDLNTDGICNETLSRFTNGGVQGLCIGLLSAIAISYSKTRSDLAQYAAIAVRLAMCVGVAVDIDEANSEQPTVCLSARWSRKEGDYEAFEAVVKRFPEAYVSVRMDGSSATITTNEAVAPQLMRYLEDRGALVKCIDIQGHFHHARHESALRSLVDLCESAPMLQFPQHVSPSTPLRRNDTGELVKSQESLHEMALECILVKGADWDSVMRSSVQSLANDARSGVKIPVLVLGPVDCIPRSISTISPLQTLRPIVSNGSQRYSEGSIAIIGTSCFFPDSKTRPQFWDTIISKGTPESLSGTGDFDHAFFRKSAREAEYMDPQHRLALHLAYEALESGGYFSPSTAVTDDVGCYIGVSSSDYQEHVDARPPTAFSFTGTARAFGTGRISHFFGLTGPSMAIDTACSSSGVAINTACKAIQSGECSMALAGGINLMTPEARSHQNLGAASFLSPSKQCRPFDASADGYRRGEGGGLVLLKKLSDAVADHDHILGVITASAVNNSKGNRSITLPSSESQSSLYRRVLKTASMHSDQISYVEAHGTGTQKGDPIEYQSIRDVFGGRKTFSALDIGSIKANIGHLEAASGVASLLKVVSMLQHNIIPPQANFTTLNPNIAPTKDEGIQIAGQPKAWDSSFKAALINNYGASGANAAMILCQPPTVHFESAHSTTRPRQYPILISAHSRTSLMEYFRSLLSLIEERNDLGDDLLPSLAFQLAQTQNQSLSQRLFFSVRSVGDLKDRLEMELQRSNTASQKLQIDSKPIVLVFSGQTGHRPQLNQDLYLGSTLLRYHLGQCDRILQSLGLKSLFPTIFDSRPIDDLVDLHCIQFSLQFSIAKAWLDSGLKVCTLVGHSLGQLTSLCVSGAVDLRDGLKLISGRASLVQNNWGVERGCMLSVDADAASVYQIINSLPEICIVEIACYNSPSSHVVVGAEAAITSFENIAQSQCISTKRLPITHGFHSEMLDSIMDQYCILSKGITLKQPTIPIESCTEHVGNWTNITPELIAHQSREPVYFHQAISRIEKRLGSCLWLEAGSSSPGITLTRRALANSSLLDSHSFCATRLQNPDSLDCLADTTIALWNEGASVQYWLYHSRERYTSRALQLPSYQFEKSRHWLPMVPKSQGLEKFATNQNQPTRPPPELISPIGKIGLNSLACEFSINQQSEEYERFVKGRTVFGQYLAPSSVYIESVSRGLNLLYTIGNADISHSVRSIEIDQMRIHAPFGLDLQKQLRLRIKKQATSEWTFTITSHPVKDGNESPKLQASGFVRCEQNTRILCSHRPLFHHIHEQCLELFMDKEASVFQGSLAKNMLSRIAKYDDAYFGIQSITFKDLKAVGKVNTPKVASRGFPRSISSPPIFDNFLLVAELHATSIGNLSTDDLYICSGYDNISVNASEKSLSSPGESWLVSSHMDHENNKTMKSDIIVFNAIDKSHVMSILGASFTKVSASSLERTLAAMNDAKLRTGTSQISLDQGPQTRFPKNSAMTIDTAGNLHFHKKSGFLNVATDLVPGEDSALEPSYSCGLPSMEHSRDSSDSSSAGSPSPVSSDEPVSELHSSLLDLLAEHLDCSQGISPEIPLGDIGLDSLVSIQLQSDIEKAFGKRLEPMAVNESTTLSELCGMVFHQSLMTRPPATTVSNGPPGNVLRATVHGEVDPVTHHVTIAADAGISPQIPRPFVTCATNQFAVVKNDTSRILRESGFAGFFTTAYQKQKALVLAYILEAFSALGCDLKQLKVDEPLPSIVVLPKHEQLLVRLHEILEEGKLISRLNGQLVRTAEPVPKVTSPDIIRDEMLIEYSKYQPDIKLLGVTGPHLADCLSGRADPLKLLFQDKTSFRLLEDVYVSSPMFATGNRMLGELIRRIGTQYRHSDRDLRILEIGAGTGGTTRLILDQLLRFGINFAYTFTDISSALVSGSKKKFHAQYGQDVNMEFTVLNIEKPPPSSMLYSYDLVLSSNCIHATQDLALSCANMAHLLSKEGGMLCLLELTRPLGWLDCVFGLLDGWWRFNDGRKYALAGTSLWKTKLLGAGFKHVDWTDDGSPESDQFRLITAFR